MTDTDTIEPPVSVIERPYISGQISKPGIYHGVDIERYHNDRDLFDRWSISSSGLRQLIERPSLYWAHSPYNENPYPNMPSKELSFGRAAHCLLLGEGTFAEHFALPPDEYAPGKKWNFNAAVCKEWKVEQAKAGKTIVTTAELEKLKWMADSLSRNPIIQAGALNGKIERSMIAHVGSVALRARPDVVPTDSGDFADLKTAKSVDYDSLSKTVFNNGYHIQAAVVRWVAREIMPTDWQFGEFMLVFIEKTPPFDVVPLVLKEADIDLGERQARSALKTLERCISENRWPGFGGWDDDLGWVEMPGWARTRIETDMNQLGEAA